MFHRLDASAHRGPHWQANVPRQFGNKLLLGGVTMLSSQYNTTHENHIPLFGREDTETGAQRVDCLIEFRLGMRLDV
jgi:hypothetical protein